MGLLDAYAAQADTTAANPLQVLPRTAAERFGAEFDAATAPDRWFNLNSARQQWYQRAIDELHQETGKDYLNPYESHVSTEEVEKYGNQTAARTARLNTLIDANRALREVKPDAINAEGIDEQIGLEGDWARQKAASYVGTGNGLAAFVGSAIAPTPPNVAGLFIPPARALFGATTAARSFFSGLGEEALHQAVTMGALTGVTEGLDILSRRETGTAPTAGEALANIAESAAGGAVFGSAFHALHAGPRALWERWQGLHPDVRETAPLEVKDAFRTLEKEALFGNQTAGIPDPVHDKAQGEALRSVLTGQPANFDPIIAYHGSPFQFDQFDASKIGTGEGAQAFGHGLYFAEEPKIAETYRAKVSAMQGGDKPTIEGKPINWDDPRQAAAFELARHDGDRAAAADFYERTFKNSDVPRILRSGEPLPQVDLPGHLYEVALNADKNLFLDWDKPLSEQPKPIQDLLTSTPRMQDEYVRGRSTTGEAYGELAGHLGSRTAASDALRELGIPGIKYLDQGSRIPEVKILSPDETVHKQWLVKRLPNGEVFYRGPDEAAARAAFEAAPKPTHNYVVFPGNEHLIEIRKRNGEPVTPTELQQIEASRLTHALTSAQRAEPIRIPGQPPAAANKAAEETQARLIDSVPDHVKAHFSEDIAEHARMEKDVASIMTCIAGSL